MPELINTASKDERATKEQKKENKRDIERNRENRRERKRETMSKRALLSQGYRGT